MRSTKFNPGTIVLMLFIIATATLRVVFNFNYEISPLANFSPLGAMALFGGTYFKTKWKAFSFSLAVLFISDFILHQTVFRSYGNGVLYTGWYWVYGAFALMTMVARMMKKVTINRFLLSVLICVFIHWIVTDLGVWIGSKTYSQNLSGFAACLENAIPYEWRFLTGTLVYGIILFGLFEWFTRKYPGFKFREVKTILNKD
jgi:uncharacterized protein DUF6580